MPNMEHCRFSNTLSDLQDCRHHLDDEDLSPAEQEARKSLLDLCKQIADEEAFLNSED